MIMHSKHVDVQIKLLNVAYVPGVHFNLFSLHAVMQKCHVTLDAEGVHMLDGELSFMRRDAGSYVEATRIAETPRHGLLSLMAAREGIGHILFHQAPPHDNPPLPTRPASELPTPNSYAEACADEYSTIWRQAMDKEYRGLADAGTFGAT